MTPNEHPLPLKAVVFDMGDILYDASEWRRWLHGEFAKMGRTWAYREMVDAWELQLVPVYRGVKRYLDAYGDFLAEAISDETERKNFYDLSLAAKREFEGQPRRPFTGVRETLLQLREQGLRLGVLTDNELAEQVIVEKLTELNLIDCFDAVVSSVDIGYAKPDTRAYEAACARLRSSPCETLFVGHDQDELDGARACNLQTISVETTGPTIGHPRVTKLSSILQLIEEASTTR